MKIDANQLDSQFSTKNKYEPMKEDCCYFEMILTAQRHTETLPIMVWTWSIH